MWIFLDLENLKSYPESLVNTSNSQIAVFPVKRQELKKHALRILSRARIHNSMYLFVEHEEFKKCTLGT